MTHIKNLEDLEQQIQQDFIHLNIPQKSQVLSEDHLNSKNIEVVIIGAGMSSLALSLALYTQGIHAVIFDKCKEGEEGPWQKPALMNTLRSNKQAIGPALNFPSLTFQAWFKAQFGQEKWDQLKKIPRLQWHSYLQWFKKVTDPYIVYEHELIDLTVKEKGGLLTIKNLTNHRLDTYFASHTVLAMGIDSLSSPNIPHFMHRIPPKFWEHSYDGTDYKRFKQLNVGVIGYSASAMDSAATALEYGANRVDLICRCQDFPRVNRAKVAFNPGYLNAYRYWTDEKKWNFSYYLKQQRTPAPHHSVLRVSSHNNAYFHLNEHVQYIKEYANKIHLYTQKEHFVFDYLILATGFKLNWAKYPWLTYIKNNIKLWEDQYLSIEYPDDMLSQSPYLTTNFEFIAKLPNTKIDFSRLYCFNYSSSLSQGALVGMISGLEQGAPILAKAISTKIYLDSIDQQIDDIKMSEDYELDGNEWTVNRIK